jgi:nitroalkane oxidase
MRHSRRSGLADPSFNPRALMDDEPVEFTKAMETIDTIQGAQHETPQMATVG